MVDWYEEDDFSSVQDLGVDAVEGIEDLGEDITFDDLSADSSNALEDQSRLQRLEGNDPEANWWNTELDLIKQHKADVEAGRAESGEEIVRKMYGLDEEENT